MRSSLIVLAILPMANATEEIPALRDANWEAHRCKMVKGQFGDFSLRAKLKLAEAGKPFDARIIFDCVDNRNYGFVQLTEKHLWVGKAELGLERMIGAKRVPYSPAESILIRKWQREVAVFSGRRLLLGTPYVGAATKGNIGFGLKAGKLSVASFRPQRLERISFTDDFMAADEEAAAWDTLSGTWGIKTIKNPLRSANAFQFVGTGKGKPALAVTGHSFWHDYTFTAACRPMGSGAMGLVFYYDETGHYLFRWTAGKKGKREVLRVSKGKPTVLTTQPGGYVQGLWYRLSVEVRDRVARCAIDRNTVATVQDAGLCSGKAGLYVEGEPGCHFDDVGVESIMGVNGSSSTLAGWQTLGGQWKAEPTKPALAGGPRPGKLLTGDATWQDYRVAADILPQQKTIAGLCFCYQDEGNHYRLGLNCEAQPRLELTRVADHVAKTMSLPAPKLAKPLSLRAAVEENVVRAYANGKLVFEEWDTTLPGGRAGLFVGKGTAQLASFSLGFLGPFDRSIISAHKTFSGEKSMANWASAEGEWITVPATVAGKSVSTVWHRADLLGEGGISISLEGVELPSDGSAKLALYLNALSKEPQAGYTASLALAAEPSVTLQRAGEAFGQKKLAKGCKIRTLVLQRVGSVVAVYVNGEPVIVSKDKSPLPGDQVGWCADGLTLDPDAVSVFSRNVLLDGFRKAPTNWRVAAGLWDVTVRWECDPRWSFFSGRGGMFANSKTMLAAIWHKQSFHGDVTVELTVGQKMAREFGAYADYTRDFNVTIGADGRHLTSGYTFTYGGWHNQKTAIVRGTKTVAEAESPLIPSSMHRQWFNIKVRRRGKRLSYLLDDALLLEYEDPKPLNGGRIALWTYDNGIMISRFRISSENPGSLEHPDFKAAALWRCMYDKACAGGGKKGK